MAPADGEDAESAFLKAMKAQQEADSENLQEDDSGDITQERAEDQREEKFILAPSESHPKDEAIISLDVDPASITADVAPVSISRSASSSPFTPKDFVEAPVQQMPTNT